MRSNPNRIDRTPRTPGGPTKKRCTQFVSGALSPLPLRCTAPVHRAGRCTAHYDDWRAAKDARRRSGGIAVNPERRARKALAIAHGATTGRQKRIFRKALRHVTEIPTPAPLAEVA